MNSDKHPKIKLDDGVLRLGFGEYGNQIDTAAISEDGRLVLIVLEVGVADIFDIRSREKIATIKPESPLTGSNAGPTSSPFTVFIESADFATDGKHVALGLNDGTCHIYNVQSSELVSRIMEPIGLLPKQELKRRAATEAECNWELVRCVRFSPDGKLLAIGHFESSVSLWDSTGKEVVGYFRPTVKPHNGTSQPRFGLTTSLGFSKDSKFLFSGTSDQLCFVWDIDKSECVFAAAEHTASVLNIHVDGNRMRWANTNGEVYEAVGSVTRLIARSDGIWTAAALSDRVSWRQSAREA